MATYLPGVTGYVPQIQPFVPNYNFYSGALQMKQTQYDTNHKQISNLYGSLLNSPMMRDKNIKEREQFFKAVDQDIHKMSGMDLSLQQNVQAASNVFNQLLENENIVKDMAWTRNWKNEQQRAEGFRNCVDPEECGGQFWEGGVKALQYQAEEFRNASDQEAMGMGNARFTPSQDIVGEAIKLAKEAGLSMTVDQLQGGYITTTKNGPQLMGPLADLFMGKFGNDPRMKEYYQTKAYVDRKDWIQSNAQIYGSEEAAEQEFVKNLMAQQAPQLQTKEKDLEFKSNTLSGQKRQLQDRIREEGTTPNGTLADQYRKMNQLEQEVVESHKVVKNANGKVKIVQNNTGNPRAAMKHIDDALGTLYMQNDIMGAAQTLAMKDFEFSMKEDPYAFEDYKHSNRMALESQRHKNRIELGVLKGDIELPDESKNQNIMDMGDYGDWRVAQEGTGTVDAGEFQPWNKDKRGSDQAYDKFEEVKGKIVTEKTSSERAILKDVVRMTQMQSRNEGGEGMASQDLVKMADNLIKNVPSDDPATNKMKSMWQTASPEDKLKMAQNYDFKKLTDSDAAPDMMYSDLFHNVVDPMLDMKNPANLENRRYLGQLWQSPEIHQHRINAYKTKAALDHLDDWYADESQEVLGKVVKDADLREFAPFFKHYIDPETGKRRSEDDYSSRFADDLMQNLDGNLLGTMAAEMFDKMQASPGYTYAEGESIRLFEPSAEAVEKYGEDGAMVYELGKRYAEDIYREDQALPTKFGNIIDAVITGGVRSGIGLTMGQYQSPSDFANINAADYDGKADQGLHSAWRRAWSKYASKDGGNDIMNALGIGGEATNVITKGKVDPLEIKNGGTLATLSYLEDGLQLGPDAKRISIGAPGSSIPESNSGWNNADAIYRKVYEDFTSGYDKDDKDRPVMYNVTYQNIAGGDSEWAALNFKLSPDYIQKHVGTEKNQGVFYGMEDDLAQNGITTYVRKDQANNPFVKSGEKTPLSTLLEYKKEVPIDMYPETADLKLQQIETGGYSVEGKINYGFYEDGRVMSKTFYKDYKSPLTSPDRIMAEMQQFLQEKDRAFRTLKQQYNMTGPNRVNDPAQL